MSAIQCGDGQDVHYSEDDGQKGCHRPEVHPVPAGGEDPTNGNETSQAFPGADLGPEQQAEVAEVVACGGICPDSPGRDRGQERVLLAFRIK